MVTIMRMGYSLFALLLVGCSGGDSDESPQFPPVPLIKVTETASAIEARLNDTTLWVQRDPLSYRLLASDGSVVVSSAADAAASPMLNADYARCNDRQDGIDRCYPGLPETSYQPLSYLTQSWQHVTSMSGYSQQGRELTLDLATSDSAGAVLRVSFAEDGAIEFDFQPKAVGVQAVADAWAAPQNERYFGGGQCFSGFELRGSSLPLWISHGGGSDRGISTNEIAVPFFWSTAGWGLWGAQDSRGEINFAKPAERRDAIGIVREASSLKLVFYAGTPQQILSLHTARSGRPQIQPPDWMWSPMVWQDSDTTTSSVRALVDGMQQRGIPLGAVWLDNPWDAGKGSFDFDRSRFEDPDALIHEVHDKGVRFMVWLSPFMTGDYEAFARERGWLVTGTRPDNNDATYYPARGIDPHVDFTHADAVNWWREGLRKLVARGVDGAKLDRCEEDLSDDSVWHNGLHNRENHNPYCVRYHQAVFDAFSAERRDGDFSLLARGGWTGSPRWVGHWAADNSSLSGELGLAQALRSLLSLSVSGFPFQGSDIGGYAGTRQDAGESGLPIGIPSVATYLRWTQLGALSPVMQTPIPPWWINETVVANYRRYAVLHERLKPYIAAAARQAREQGVPIVRPLPYAYPDDAAAVGTLDEYLFGPDLLVAPIVTADLELGAVLRRVYLPPGDWVDFWQGTEYAGPRSLLYLAARDVLPLFVRKGASLPDGVSAQALP